MPPILPGNADAWGMYLRVQGQVITAGMDGTPIDLNYPAVFEIMRLYSVENMRECFEKVLVIFREVQELRREK